MISLVCLMSVYVLLDYDVFFMYVEYDSIDQLFIGMLKCE